LQEARRFEGTSLGRRCVADFANFTTFSPFGGSWQILREEREHDVVVALAVRPGVGAEDALAVEAGLLDRPD
jgi:hypothetical protein